MAYVKPSKLHYRIAQAASWCLATFVFRREYLRNEIRKKKGPFVVIANHECALDFVNLIGARHEPMSFVISNSFYNTLPIKNYLDSMGVIPKQQFQTTVKDLKRIKEVIDAGGCVVIYPAGLMCEDGLSTPIPSATYKFLKWLNVDVYVARTQGSYFVMPKWSKGFRPGKTTLDIYQLFSKEELGSADLETVQRKTDEALFFDAYREQETLLIHYKNNQVIRGLENVLYICPHCGKEFSMIPMADHILRCTGCGFEVESDAQAFLHNTNQIGPRIRYVSDWSKLIYEEQKRRILEQEEPPFSMDVDIQMIDYQKKKFMSVGRGTVTMSDTSFSLTGSVLDYPVEVTVGVGNIPTLPFSPGKYVEIQNGMDIYRCVPDDGKLVMKFINLIKIQHELCHSVQLDHKSAATL